MTKNHFAEVEGLRGYLALWVAVGHGLQLAGYLTLPGPLGLLMRGDAAVAGFMIVSGFVITHLLLQKSEPYGVYITRRFFRLYPCYVVCALAGFVISGIWADYVYAVPWQDTAGWAGYAQTVGELRTEVVERLWPHLIAHALMLHGAIPAEVLAHSDKTFLPAAWSISLEWQFYLVAPLVLACVRTPLRLTLLVTGVAAAYVAFRLGLLGSYDTPSLLFASSGYFAVGIASRLAFDRLSSLPTSPLAAAACVMFALLLFGRAPLPLAVWLVFYAYLLWRSRAPFTGPLFSMVFTNPLTMFVGRISYSIYLVHRPVQVALAWAALNAFPTVSKPLILVTQIAAILLAIPLSFVLFKLVEQPGIALGRRAAAALPRPVQPAPGAAPPQTT